MLMCLFLCVYVFILVDASYFMLGKIKKVCINDIKLISIKLTN